MKKNCNSLPIPFEYVSIENTEELEEYEIPIFYAIAEKEYNIPNVPYEIIAELHFTDEDKLEDDPSNHDEIEFKQNLMYEARKLAGHLDEEEVQDGYINYEEGFEEYGTNSEGGDITPMGLFGKKWRPSGTIYVEEDIVRATKNKNHYQPVRRVRVNVLKWGWLQVEHGSTDWNGYFSTGKIYTKNVHYKVRFKNIHVTIKDNNFYDTANYFSGSHKRQPLNVTFKENGSLTRYHFFALIHNATHHYYESCLGTYGLKNPGNLNITARYNGSGSDATAQWYPFNSAIRIGRLKSDGNYLKSDGVFATTVHELTHCGHRKLDPEMFSIFQNTNKVRKLMTESWAEGVETILTNNRYWGMYAANGYGIYEATTKGSHNSTRGWNGNRQHDSAVNMNAYTPLVIDLVDGLNQNTLNSYLPVDRVSGYTLNQIQSALNNSRNLTQWKNKLVNNYNNPTDQFIDDVFSYAQWVIDNNL